MSRPAKPSTAQRTKVRCDRKAYEWKPEWEWVETGSCDECGHVTNADEGYWYDVAEPPFHLGDITSDGKPHTDHGPVGVKLISAYITRTYSKGIWTCCKEASPGLAAMVDVPSPFLRAIRGGA